MVSYFVVDNLAYLVKNGRLSGAAGFVGSVLKIKPILEMNSEGKIVSKEKIKTHRHAIERALVLFCDEVKNAKKIQAFVFHTLREEEAKEIVNYLQEKCLNALPIELHMVTPAVGAHIGCGILGFGYFILEE